ncbi:MAG: hypothetical protein ACRD1T_11625, partial [Acidimicrobiia bacterium]
MNKRFTIALSIVLCLSGVGCATAKADPFEIGIRRAAIDLAFKDADKAPQAAPREVLEQFIPEGLGDIPGVRTRFVTLPFDCPTADSNQTPEVPAFAVVKDPPKPGLYDRHNNGKLRLQIGTGEAFELPYPAFTEWRIADVKQVKAINYVNEDDQDVPKEVPRETGFSNRVEFSLTRTITRNFYVTDLFRYSRGDAGASGDFIWLVKRTTVANGQTSEFNPTPPIRYIRLFVPEGTDSEVHHAGIDRETNVALAVQSKIVGREWVDVCGENIDTYRVELLETFVDLSKNPPEIGGNEPTKPSIWNIQFDNGLLIAREEVHT